MAAWHTFGLRREPLMSYKFAHLTMDELEARLRRVGAIWFKNDDMLLLEELIRRAKDRQYVDSHAPSLSDR